jgi:hypothetical protein
MEQLCMYVYQKRLAPFRCLTTVLVNPRYTGGCNTCVVVKRAIGCACCCACITVHRAGGELREAPGMSNATSPPPWLVNMRVGCSSCALVYCEVVSAHTVSEELGCESPTIHCPFAASDCDDFIALQRYGPPPSYPNLKIPGLNAPIPPGASFGYHAGGWGKPPVDAAGNPIYGDVFGLAQVRGAAAHASVCL